MSTLKDQKIIIAGAGLVGSLLALRLLQKGFQVEIFEARDDMRLNEISAGRSINLALSHRGIQALNLVGLSSEILIHAVKMNGRMIHTDSSELLFQTYSIRENEYINSISRRTLNILLMDAIEKFNVKIQFGARLTEFNPEENKFTFITKKDKTITRQNCSLISSEGANSIARKSLLERSLELRMNYLQKFQDYGYKELTIPPGEHGEFLLEKNALHIWPRGHFMMIALPNPDATFTVTLFLPFQGEQSFESLSSKDALQDFFEKYFPDSLALCRHLHEEFFTNPTGHLNSVKCNPWHYKDQLLLIGDAAHAIIPFYGQGMNCGFEDVFVLDQLLDKDLSIEQTFQQFEALRKPNSDAISDLAEDNFEEMRQKVADPIFQRKRILESQLEKKYPDYYSKYAMVTFRPDISYQEAMIKGRLKDDYLLGICLHKESFNVDEMENIYKHLQAI